MLHEHTVKIVHFIKWLRLRDGGTVRAVLDMCAGLASRGHEVFAVSADDSGVPEPWKSAAPLAPQAPATTPRNLLLTLKDPLFERGGRSMADATRDTLTQYLSKGAMADAAVAEAFKAKGITVLEGDWTRGDAAISQWLATRGRAGVPVYVYYAADGTSRELPQILTVDALTSLG
jgi:hypothetical protein